MLFNCKVKKKYLRKKKSSVCLTFRQIVVTGWLLLFFNVWYRYSSHANRPPIIRNPRVKISIEMRRFFLVVQFHFVHNLLLFLGRAINRNTLPVRDMVLVWLVKLAGLDELPLTLIPASNASGVSMLFIFSIFPEKWKETLFKDDCKYAIGI